MKSLLFLLFIFSHSLASTDNLPKTAFGKYAGEMESYTAIKNDVEMEVAAHEILLDVSEDTVFYQSGNLELSGDYEAIKQSRSEYLIKANLTNGKTLTYEMEFMWNKKKETILITGKNGQPDVMLDKLPD